MRELRINLPNELWDKFPGLSPQQMKSAISTVICLQFHVMPEPKRRKQHLSGHPHRGSGGRFTGKQLHGEPSRGNETEVVVTVAQHVPKIIQEPETPREITVQKPETPPENTEQKPEIPPEITEQRQESQPEIISESKPVFARPLKIHSSYVIGLQP